jgi:hypothetical protein
MIGLHRVLAFGAPFILAASLGLAGTAVADQHAETPIWQWTPEQIGEVANRVRAGQDLTPASWPDGAKVAVGLSFDVDTEPVWIGFQGQTSPSYMSRGQYGARSGLPRIVALLAKHDIPASFFIPAMTMELHPDVVDAVKSDPRHEFGFHS